MADIAATPFVNFGASQAQQGQAEAQAQLARQQAQQAAQQNQIMAAKMPYMLEMFKNAQAHITDFGGQTNDNKSGVSPTYDASADPAGQIPAGAPGQNRVTPYDMIGRDGNQGNVVQGALQAKFNVNPAGSDQEQARIEAAYNNKAAMDLYGDKGLSESANTQLEGVKNQRDMAVKDRVNQANIEASKYYEALSTAHDAPHPFQALSAVAPDAAARIKAANPNASDDDLDQYAQNSIGEAGAFLHRFTGRETVKGDDGIYRDKDTGQAVMGVAPAGFKPEDVAKLREEAMAPSTRTVDGREVTQKNYEWAGFHNQDQYVQSVLQQARAQQQAQTKIEQKRQGAVAIQAHAGVPPDQRIPAPGQTQPASVASATALQAQQPPVPRAQAHAAAATAGSAPMTANPTTVGGTPAPATGATPRAAAAAAGGQLTSANSPDGKLDLTDVQHSNTPNTPGAGLPRGAKPSDADITYWKALQAKNAEEGQTSAGASTAIQIAKNAQNALAQSAATGNTAGVRSAIAVALGNPESLRTILGDATSSAILRKMLGNAAFEQLETDANGNSMRLGSQTIRVAMTQLSASPEMTPEAIKALTGQMIKNASYEKQKANDYATYKAAGGDVTDFDRWYSNKYPNKTSIDTEDTIKVVHPDGRKGSIPASKWAAAQKAGYKKAP